MTLPRDDPDWVERCRDVLDMVLVERARQNAEYGPNHELEDGTGPGVRWLENTSDLLDMMTATEIEVALRSEYEAQVVATGKPTWMHLVREEIAESFKEHPGSDRLVEELVQVAALCVKWIEAIKHRG